MTYLQNGFAPVRTLKKNKHRHTPYVGDINKAHDIENYLAAHDTLVVNSSASIINSAEKIIKFLYICASKKINIFFEKTEKNIFGSTELFFKDIDENKLRVCPILLEEYYKNIPSKPFKSKLTKYHTRIMHSLEKGETLSKIAKQLEINPTTLTYYLEHVSSDKYSKKAKKPVSLDAKHEFIESMLKDGSHTRFEVASKVGCSVTTLGKYLKNSQLNDKYPRKWSNARQNFLKYIDEIKNLVEQNIPLQEVAEQYGMKYMSLNSFFNEYFPGQYPRSHKYMDKNYSIIKTMLKKGSTKSAIYKKLGVCAGRLNRFIERHPELLKLTIKKKN